MLRTSRSEPVFLDQWLVNFVQGVYEDYFFGARSVVRIYDEFRTSVNFRFERMTRFRSLLVEKRAKSGKILKVDSKTGRVTVEKIEYGEAPYSKPTQTESQGGIVEKELPLHYSNVLLLCPKCNRGVRHGIKC